MLSSICASLLLCAPARSEMTQSPPPDLLGTVVADRYRVERLIGQGGMGSVWAARHLSLGQLVAIKFIHPRLLGSREARSRFDNEAKAAARIKSRHAVQVMDHGVADNRQPYIVMEFLEGETLEDRVRRLGPRPLFEVVSIVSQASKAVTAAHQAGIVHRDLKPENIFLAIDRELADGSRIVKVVDFGIAKMVHDEAATGAAATQAGALLGTPHFMSPEALTGAAQVGVASDVWSLGACAFAAVCGRTPFEGNAIGEIVLKVCSAPLPVPTEVNPMLPRAFDAWFAKACERDPARRFGSVDEMSKALSELDRWALDEKETSAFEIRPRQPSRLELELAEYQAPSRGRFLAGVLGGIALTLAVLGYFVFERTRAANEAAAEAAARAAAALAAQNAAGAGKAEFAGPLQQTPPDAGADVAASAQPGH